MTDSRFEWQRNKNKTNISKHQIGFNEASTVFGDPKAITVFDSTHSNKEERFKTLGISAKGRLLVVIHTERKNVIRIINARKAIKNEIKQYQEEKW
jgi:uncharacterized DUF497 family protein